jgi:hypothetical protein
VAIVQISRITNRKGKQIDLPQLAGAELGWCEDTRRLFIGNGQLPPDGSAPEIGNTEILTEFSPLFPVPTVAELLNNVASPSIIFTESVDSTKAFNVSYTIVRGTTYRTGTLTVVAGSVSGSIAYRDDFLENASTGIILTATQIDSTIYVNYTSTNTGTSASMAYVVSSLL